MLFIFVKAYTQDWQGIPIPANPGNGKVWQIQNQHSDDFNYNGKNSTFKSKWLDNHRGGWSGPGETQFSSNHSDVTGGNLRIKAGRVTNIPKKTVYCGHVTTKTPVVYPVYTEVRMRCSGINLSSNFWLLSADDVNEIDVTETYGAENVAGRKMATNYHIFRRTPFLDLANSPKSHDSEGNVFLRDGYHRFGLYWKSATEFEFYFDGKLVRKLNRSNDLRDPRNRFFDQAMHIIMNTELHTWKSNAGIRPSNQELNNNSINKMYIDWIRTYKPVSNTTGVTQLINNGTYFIKSAQNNQRLLSRTLENHSARMHDPGNFEDQQWVFDHKGNNVYTIQNKGTGRFLEVPYAKCGDGVNVATWTDANDAHKKWKVVRNGSGVYGLKPMHCITKALDRQRGEIDANVHIWGYSNTNSNQKWEIIPFNNKSLSIKNIQNSIVVYPNPVKDQATITGNIQGKEIVIYNLLGNIISIKVATSDQETITTSDLDKGIYIISVAGEIQLQMIKK